MKAIIEEYGKIILYVTLAIMSIFGVYNALNTKFSSNINSQLNAVDIVHSDSNADYTTKKKPELTLNDSIKIYTGDYFDVLSTPGVLAIDGTTGADITNDVLVYGELKGRYLETVIFNGNDWINKRRVKVEYSGVYTLRYSIRDSSGFYETKNIQIIVERTIE